MFADSYNCVCLMCGYAFAASTQRVLCFLCRAAPLPITPAHASIIRQEMARLAPVAD